MLALEREGIAKPITPKLNRFVANQVSIFQKYLAFSEKIYAISESL